MPTIPTNMDPIAQRLEVAIAAIKTAINAVDEATDGERATSEETLAGDEALQNLLAALDTMRGLANKRWPDHDAFEAFLMQTSHTNQ